MGNLKIPTISMFISSLESPSHCNGNDYDHLAMLLSVREANTWRHMSSTTLIFSKEGTNFHLTSHVYHGDTVIQFAATFHQPEIPRCGGCNFKTTQWTNQYTSVTYLKKKGPPREKRQEIFKFRFLEYFCHWFQTNAHHNTVTVFR